MEPEPTLRMLDARNLLENRLLQILTCLNCTYKSIFFGSFVNLKALDSSSTIKANTNILTVSP